MIKTVTDPWRTPKSRKEKKIAHKKFALCPAPRTMQSLSNVSVAVFFFLPFCGFFRFGIKSLTGHTYAFVELSSQSGQTVVDPLESVLTVQQQAERTTAKKNKTKWTTTSTKRSERECEIIWKTTKKIAIQLGDPRRSQPAQTRKTLPFGSLI